MASSSWHLKAVAVMLLLRDQCLLSQVILHLQMAQWLARMDICSNKAFGSPAEKAGL